MAEQKKYVEYAGKILGVIQDMLNNEDNEFYIGEDELREGDNLTHFMHALATVAPCRISNSVTDEELTWLQFNHKMNHVLIQYIKQEEKD